MGGCRPVSDSPAVGKDSVISRSCSPHQGHQVPAMIHRLAAKCQSELVGSEQLQSQGVPEAPQPPESSRTHDQNNPTDACSDSWRTGSQLYSC